MFGWIWKHFGNLKTPETPSYTILYRCGSYFIVRCKPWFLVCDDSEDVANPVIVRECALALEAISEVDRLYARSLEKNEQSN